ncbi:MAG: quinone-dependent dihydroorotate dehydrogenase [Candidatus Velthaea sp.]
MMDRKLIVVVDPYVFAKPILHRLDPETAHELTLRALEAGFVPKQPSIDDPRLSVELFGRRLASPIGLAAGFDKNARVYDKMYAQGFDLVEVGGVTPLPQEGNPRPRVFRLAEDGGVINRMGFPNEGADVVEWRLRRFGHNGFLGINLASNTQCADPAEDFVSLVRRFAAFADFLTLDISCPNTDDGQVFLQPERLRELLARVNAIALPGVRPAFAAKLSPDIEDARLEAIVDVLVTAGIDAIIVSNTTAQRPVLASPNRDERGGLSGRPLFAASTAMLARVAELTNGAVPLIGVGGIASGADAYAKIRAGATAIQIYTALIYGGTALVTQIKRDLAVLLARDGFASVRDAIGAR